MKLFSSNCLISGQFEPALIQISDGVITQIDLREPVASDGQYLNLRQGYLIPGLIDLQINGVNGVDFSNCDENQAKKALKSLIISGTTAILPTVITSPIQIIKKQVKLLSGLVSDQDMCRNLGVHLEGPVLSSTHRGAHDESLLLSPADFLATDIELSDIKMLTLAPELEGVGELIELAKSKNVIVSMGHTNAAAKETRTAIELGATMVTHLFNGMRQIHQREPGIATTTLLAEELNFGIILDGEHVNYELVKLAQKIAGHRMIVVSDASAALLSEPGTVLELGGLPVFVDDNDTARRADGTLASSGKTQLQAIENAVLNGMDRAFLINAASRVPADLIGQKHLGRIEVGAKADLVHYRLEEKPLVDLVIIEGVTCQF